MGIMSKCQHSTLVNCCDDQGTICLECEEDAKHIESARDMPTIALAYAERIADIDAKYASRLQVRGDGLAVALRDYVAPQPGEESTK